MSGRVVQVVPTANFAGVERYVCEVSGELSRRGWDVVVIGGDHTAMRACLPSAVELRSATGVVTAVRELWRTHHCDVIHTHMTVAEVAGACVSSVRGDTLVTTRHFARPRGASYLGRFARPLIASRMATQIAISQYVADRIDGPSEVLLHGVAPSGLSPGPRRRTVIMMQRLEPEKQTAAGIEAWAQSGLADAGWRLEIHGVGSEEAALKGLVTHLRLEESVRFAGFEPHARLRLSRAGILLAPTEVEGFGLTVVEAMAEATPVVAAAAGAHLETLGPEALTYPLGSIPDAAAHLRLLASDDDRRHGYGLALQRRYEQFFTLQRHVDRLEEIYAR